MRYAIIENNIVTNVIEADGSLPGITMVQSDTAGIGHIYDGGFSAPPETPTPVPQSVSPRQIRQALTRAGLRASVEAAVAAGDQDTQDWYYFSNPFERGHQVVSAMGASLGVSDAQLDALWILADSL